MNKAFSIPLVVCALAFGACDRPDGPPTTAATAAVPTDAVMHHEEMTHVPTTLQDWSRGATLFAGLGDFHRPISTVSGEAQKYFDQGMRFMWAFNHDEATRSFARAAEIDPACAACFWGLSLTVGPNYNLPYLGDERAKVAVEALGRARENIAHASPVERALIEALISRYPAAVAPAPAELRAALLAYAAAMKAVATQYPQDLDVKTLYAEALMNTNAWKLWSPAGQPAPGTNEIVAILESVLERDPRHPGANHYYVHALEASPHPARAVASAERLRDAMPAAGHLVHMPAHIMQRIGRYQEAAEANRQAVAADRVYASSTRAPDYYPVMYTAHNYQFLAYSTAMQGRRAETLAAVDASRKVVPDLMLLSMPGMDWYVAELYVARIRFGLWDEMLALPAPDPRLPGLTGAFLYGRAVALAAKGRLDEARASVVDLQKLMAALPADAPAGQNTLIDVLGVALPLAQARIAAAAGESQRELALLQQAVTAEDRIAYDEPKNWFFPARHVLGARLLEAGRAQAAERVYRKDLEESPANGWALYGLSKALRTQGKTAQAATISQEFAVAWQQADVTLTASAF